MVHLLDLPHEVLNSVLIETQPADLAALAQSCHSLRSFVRHNQLLHREVYLRAWDTPLKPPEALSPQWEEDVHNFVRLRKLLETDDQEVKDLNLNFISRTIQDLISKASPDPTSENIGRLARHFADSRNRDTVLYRSSLFSALHGFVRGLRSGGRDRQLSAKLHCLYGVPIGCSSETRISLAYPHAAARVYDLRNYTDRSMWGPFMEDHSSNVDWERMEAIMVVLGFNLRARSERRATIFRSLMPSPFAGVTRGSYCSAKLQGPVMQPELLANVEDPYGITGTWMRVVCFLDYTELFAFNFTSPPPPPGRPRQPLDTEEATRLIIMQLQVTRTEAPAPDQGQDLPVAHFIGTSRAMHPSWDPNANSTIKGTVHLTSEGEVRWTTMSIIQGEERWKSEGIQVGGVRSARGVMGSWFDKDYNPHGPVGPTAFWKLSDDQEQEKPSEYSSILLNATFH